MYLFTSFGLFESSLRTTCAILACIYLLFNILLSYGIFMSRLSWFFELQCMIYIILSLILILGTMMKNRFFCLPWIFGVLYTAIALFLAFFSFDSSEPPMEVEVYFQQQLYLGKKTSYLTNLMYCTLRLLAELIILRYAYSYYFDLRRGQHMTPAV